MSYAASSKAKAAGEQFAEASLIFEIKQLHRDGLYGHWRCGEPGSSVYHFNVTTWPGFLCYTGDMGDYLFQRTDDMIAFMRGSAMSFDYAAEKCVAADRHGITEWSYDLFIRYLDELTMEACAEDLDRIADVRESARIAEGERGKIGAESECMLALYDSRLVEGCDMPEFREHTYHFLWALHALKWFADKVEDVKQDD